MNGEQGMRSRLLLALAGAIGAIIMTGPVAAQDANSAQSFLAEAYRHYTRNSKGIQHYERYLHTSLLALIKADVKASGTDIPVSGDGDLFCDCQDWEGIWDLKIDVKLLGKDRAEAAVSFFLSDPKDSKVKDEAARSLRFSLVVESGQWRIYNAVSYRKDDKSYFDLRAEMEKEINAYAAEEKHKKAN
jgi:hypothetical protein